MTVAEILAQLHKDLPPKLSAMLEEAAGLRQMVRGGDIKESPTDLHNRLLDCRAALDRVEEILTDLSRLKAKTAQAVSERQDLYDDRYAQVATAPSGHAEYSTGKEREAKYSLSLMDEQLNLRKAVRMDSELGAAVDYVKTLYWGLNGVRNDLDSRIRLIVLEGQLEH